MIIQSTGILWTESISHVAVAVAVASTISGDLNLILHLLCVGPSG